jgi:Chaperone of endosialidase
MATLTKGKTFINGELVTPQKLHELVDLASVGNIVNADIASNAAIADSKLAQITTVGKVLPAAVQGTAVITTDSRLSDARPPTTHTHDDRYYTETEINTLLAGKQASGSYAPATGIAQTSVTNLTTDLAGKAASSHTHDDRYYTESEMNTLLAGKQASGSYAPATGIAPSAISGRFNNFIFGFLNEAGFGGFETTTAIGTTIVSDAGRNSLPEAILARWQRTNGSGVTSTIGTITTTGSGASITGVAYNTTSDYRLKTNIEPLTDALSRLLQIPAHRFNWLADPSGQKVDGFLAHEAQAVVPEAVTGTKDAVDADGKPVYQGIDQSKLVPLLVAAVQELSARVEALEAK